MIKTILKLSLISSLILISTSAKDINSPSEAVNLAGKQRMFTQKMLKDYIMVGMHNKFGNPTKSLKSIIDNFEDNLNSLYSYTKSSETKKYIDGVRATWNPIKKILMEKPQLDKAMNLQEDLDNLLKETDKTTQLFIKELHKESGNIVNVSGRQRMLSQRMASLYMLKVWGVNDPKFKDKLYNSMDLFKSSLKELESSEDTTQDISFLLKKVKRSFMFFEMMNRRNSKKFIPALISRKSDDILKNMDKATSEYVENKKK